ncbi:MAG: 2-octaprenyl-6-methoxyphenyl hydroxylase [Lysobacterales bacterium RIFOXYD1_FULL_69_11]|nr:MAG: 2-octaprenyl-6-methoxyphenyl hydroxylase [Xanthomonadales bacterium RIFOXYA1_FULL_69_10]OHE87975.1 MAG: 2-octaprenyl-6-methoxyphenyl hydroxylase [Xanthomonadales bacterium RIFOXYD1_FULL_69_11]
MIVGGGLVGSSLAIALARIGVDVGLVEATAPGSLPPVFDQRNLSFAEASVNALTALGVMQKLRAPTGAIRRIHVSRQGDFGRVVLDAGRHGREEFGRVVVARDFGEALEARVAELPGIVRYRPMRFEATSVGSSGGSLLRDVRLSRGGDALHLRTRLLVGADGADSGVRRALGIGHARHDYGQVLFVCRLRTDGQPDGTAFERLGPGGPTALLPRGDRHYGLVLGVPADEAAAVSALDDAAFLARAQATFGWRAGRFLECGPRSAYPAVKVEAEALAGERAVLVGNAAQAIHPLGAQGFNLGLRDAMTLVDLIEATRRDGAEGDVGHPDLLQAYVARRREDRAATIAFSDGLARMGANGSRLLGPLRSLGLFAADRLPSVQAGLVGGALGYRGDVPNLCRRSA